MALNGKGYGIGGYLPIYPGTLRLSTVVGSSCSSSLGTLNAWLRTNQGYVCIDGDCDNLVLDAPNNIAPGRVQFISEVRDLRPLFVASRVVRSSQYLTFLLQAEKPSITTMKANIVAGNPVQVAHVCFLPSPSPPPPLKYFARLSDKVLIGP